MKAEDFRNMTFADLQKNISGMRDRVYRAWLEFGPGTTAEVAIKAEIGLLTFRPRTTDLYQMGLVEIDYKKPASGHEGRYIAVQMDEWKRRREARPLVPEQTMMKLGV